MLVVKKRLSDGLAQATTLTVEDVERHICSPDKWLSPLLLRWALNASEQGAESAQCISGIEAYRAMGIEIPKERGFPLPFFNEVRLTPSAEGWPLFAEGRSKAPAQLPVQTAAGPSQGKVSASPASIHEARQPFMRAALRWLWNHFHMETFP